MCTENPGCDREDSSAGMRTCQQCRSSTRRLLNKPPSKVTKYFAQTKVRVGRAKLVNSILTRKDELGYIDYEALQDKGIMMPPKKWRRRQAKSAGRLVTVAKRSNKKRKVATTVTSHEAQA